MHFPECCFPHAKKFNLTLIFIRFYELFSTIEALLRWCSFFEQRFPKEMEQKPPPLPPSPPLPWDSTVTSDLTLEYPSPRLWNNKGANPERGSNMVPGNGTPKSPENAEIWNFADFREFHKIPGILWNFEIFQKFQEFCNSGSLFGGMLRMLTKPMLFYRFLSSFSLKNHFIRKKWKFPKISAILVKFQEFHQIWWNSTNSTNFGVLGFPISTIFTPSEHLKQKR